MSRRLKTHNVEPLHHLDTRLPADTKPFYTAFVRPHIVIPLLVIIALLVVPVIAYSVVTPQTGTAAAVEQTHADSSVERVTSALALDAECSPFESLTHCISTEAATLIGMVEPPM